MSFRLLTSASARAKQLCTFRSLSVTAPTLRSAVGPLPHQTPPNTPQCRSKHHIPVTPIDPTPTTPIRSKPVSIYKNDPKAIEIRNILRQKRRVGDMSSSSPLVWIDCEMTGLHPVNDTIIEICCYVTDSNLKIITPEPFEVIIHKPKEVMDAMDDWCVRTHGQSGLTKKVLESTVTPDQVGPKLLEFIKKHVPYPRYGLLAGNSVHADRHYLQKEFPEVIEYLHYRIVDVSSFKECAKMWCNNETLRKLPAKKGTHRARDDILESIEELKVYRKMFFEGK